MADPAPPTSCAPRFSWKTALLIFIAATLPYATTLTAGFTNWDDPGYVLQNPDLPLASADQWRSVLTRTRMDNFAPIHILSYAIDYRFWGLRPAGFHLTNILLQGLCAILLFTLIEAVNGRPRTALLGSLIFAFHPLGVEVVAWVSERKTLLSACFMLAALLAYFRVEGSRAWRWAFVSLVLFALGLGSKMAIAPFPLLLVVLHRVTGVRVNGARFALGFATLGLAIASGIAIMHAHTSAGHLPGLFGGSPARHFGALADNFGIYVRKLAFPIRLSPMYDFRHGANLNSIRLAVEGAAALGVFATAAWLFLRRRPSALWLCGALLFWLPASSILVPIHVPIADHYLYLPLIFLAPLASLHLQEWQDRQADRRAGALVLVALLLLAALTMNQTRIWRSSLDLWSYAVSIDRDNPWARRMLAHTHLKEGRPEEAVRHARVAVMVVPRFIEAWELLGTAALRAGDLDGAESAFRSELALEPRVISPLLGIARVNAARGENRKALETTLEILRQKRDYQEAAEYLVKLARENSLAREALAGLPVAPTSAWIELARGDLLAMLGRREEARKTWRKILFSRPGFAPVLERLGAATKTPQAPSDPWVAAPRPRAPR